MGLVLDTDVCIGILNNIVSQDVFLPAFRGEKIYITSLSVFELYRGIFRLYYSKTRLSDEKFQQKLKQLEKFISNFTVLDYGRKAAQISADISEKLRQHSNIIGIYDCQIAGTIIAHGMNRIATWNIKHFSQMPELTVINLPRM